MTITATPPATETPAPIRSPAKLKVTLPRVIKSEWVKLRSLRSTQITLLTALIVFIGLGALFAATTSGQLAGPDGEGNGPPIGTDPTGITLSGVMLAQLIIGSLGVMVTASEYTTGMIRSSLIGVPKRLPVLWAKALVFGVVTFVLMTAAAFVAFLVGQGILANGDAPTAALSDDGVLRAIFGTSGTLTGVGLLGLALGALLRNTAAAISTLIGTLLVLPGLILLAGGTIAENVGPYLPSRAAEAFRTLTPNPLTPGTGLAVFLGYVVVSLAAAAILLKRRDA
jgi:ABC-2 type transport system permease protein